MGYTIPLRNRPDGYPGLGPAGDLVGELVARAGTAAQLTDVVPVSGEHAYATDTMKLVIGDGKTSFAKLPDLAHRTVVTMTDWGDVPDRDGADLVYNVGPNGTPQLMAPTHDGQRLTIIADYPTINANFGSLFYVGDAVMQGYDSAVGGVYAYHQNYYPVADSSLGAMIQVEATSCLLKDPNMQQVPPLVWTVVNQVNLTTGEGF